ncbi:hypothetical protein N7476_001941 [Penicillium atrosanguineum]|uniref:Uncharacterized protein n=1 Tax=Penicillium atrosanguineum TaxID=1132637 RepID=A0A9W9U719_9EURO|nr:hypothetical protein N7476_001941 [Penicillium atrosanguineum]
MVTTGNIVNTTPAHALTDPEKAVHPESDFDGETEQGFADKKSQPGSKPEDVIKLEDAGPPDGGTAAWLVVLGAWCCSFSSPGWVNSTYFYDLYNVFLASRYVASDINAMG